MDIIGEQYHVLTVLTITASALGAGSTGTYSPLLTTRCALKNGGGSRGNIQSIIEGNSSFRIITRYQSALWAAVSMSMKLTIDGVTYTMQGWERIKDKRKEFIQFNVTTNAQ